MVSRVRGAVLVMVLLVVGARTGFAQTRPGYRPVFQGDGSSDAAALTFAMTMTESYDDDLLAEAGATPQPSLHPGGLYSSLFPQITLRTHGRDVSFTAFGSSSFRYYPSFGQPTAVDHTAGGGMIAKLGRSTTLTVNGSFGYAPTYLYALFAGPTGVGPIETAGPAAAYQSDSLRSYIYGGTTTLDHTIGRKATVSLTADLNRTTFVGHVPGFVDTQTASAGGRFTYQLNRGVALRLGYTNRVSDYSAVLRTQEHDFDIGFAFTKNLSSTRRLTAGFSLGPTVTELPLINQPSKTGRLFRTTGDAFVERQIGRTWLARASFRRGLGYAAALTGPSYTTNAMIEAGGFLNRRVDLHMAAGYATGAMAAQIATGSQFTTYTADARLRIGLSRQWALFVETLQYDYQFDENLILVPGLPRQYNRLGLHVGFMLWQPMWTERHAPR